MIDLVRLKAVYVRILQARSPACKGSQNYILEMAAADLEVVLGQAGVPREEIALMTFEGLRG